MQLHRDAWYVAALPQDVDRQLKRRVILNDPILIYRSERHGIVAIQDRCPHRFAPLSRGTLFGDAVQCKYHGLRFDPSGHCVLNPHGDAIAPHNRVRSYPAEERHGLVWIWMGDPALAHDKAIPDLSYMSASGLRTVHCYIRADYRYDILVDNLMDLSHADYLHVGSFSNGACHRSETRVKENDWDVTVLFQQWGAPAPPGFNHLGERVDQLFHIRWRPGQIISFEFSAAPLDGDPFAGPKVRFAHIVTPETDGTTHYFMSTTRDYAIDDPAVDTQEAARLVGVIQGEDSPMLEAINAAMEGEDLMAMHPVVLPTDKGAMRVRRVMKRLIGEETARSSPAPTSPEAICA